MQKIQNRMRLKDTYVHLSKSVSTAHKSNSIPPFYATSLVCRSGGYSCESGGSRRPAASCCFLPLKRVCARPLAVCISALHFFNDNPLRPSGPLSSDRQQYNQPPLVLRVETQLLGELLLRIQPISNKTQRPHNCEAGKHHSQLSPIH